MAASNRAISAIAIALLALGGGARSSAALSAPTGLEGIRAAEPEALEALAIYPEGVRRSILEASTRPGILSRIESIRAWSNRDFRTLLSDRPREQQAALWELVRYPDLVAELVRAGPGSARALERIAAQYPEEIRRTAVDSAREDYPLLVEIDALHREAQEAFEELIADTPPQARAAFRELLALPEVLSILTDRMRMTALLGEAYERDPEGVEAAFAELHLEVARQNAEELEEWEQELEGDPELLAELEDSAQLFAEENGYDPDAPRVATVVNYHVYPYPYWFGFPFWLGVGFSYPVWHADWFWYPLPYWAHTGFYYGPHHTLVVFGVPSFYYLNWHFSSHHHHHRYEHLSHRIDHHFEAHHQRHYAERQAASRGYRQARESGETRRRPSPERVRENSFVSRAGRRSPASAAWPAEPQRIERRPVLRRTQQGGTATARRQERRPARESAQVRAAEVQRQERRSAGEKPQVRAAEVQRQERRPTREKPQVRTAKIQRQERPRAQVRPQPTRVAKAQRVEQRIARPQPVRNREPVSPRASFSAPGGGRPSLGRRASGGFGGRSGYSPRRR